MNEENISRSREQMSDYNRQMTDALNQRDQAARPSRAATGNPAGGPGDLQVAPTPSIPETHEIDENLSGYVNFKHPWGGKIRDATILAAMLLVFFMATLVGLRAKEVWR